MAKRKFTSYLGRGSANVEGIRIRAGSSYARETAIDPYIDEGLVEEVYEKWSDEWQSPQVFQGGVTSITCEMILQVPVAELGKVFGADKTARILKAARFAANHALVEK
jgi:hypothetical protein